MRFDSDFEEKVKQAQIKQGWGGALPGPLLVAWESLVEQCECGYGDNFDELMQDFQNRQRIDIVLEDEDLDAHADMARFRECVKSLDDRFKRLQLDEPVFPLEKYPWWESYPLRIGKKGLAEDYLDMFGIRIEIVS
ncbi:hypothetical protein F1721_09655 [Saccharopolyspora hirsuta]|uniref:Uncharacterized protein n=1 Tax=Saccharopolyspora hirsuta TaxID=1837 RepID=A0A5M7C9Q4_SACHI|nr:hypothetical protein [Saccharopolyspora hirsuta]KAA5835055.1 hypothetical protein F1721_09655 [Saccharopolyspora hirsuta]